MDRFRSGQRIVVVASGHPLEGRRGTVRRLNVGDRGASVAIDGGLPDDDSIIIDGEPCHDRTILQPQQCRELR